MFYSERIKSIFFVWIFVIGIFYLINVNIRIYEDKQIQTYYFVFIHPWSGHVSNVVLCATAFSPIFTGEPCSMFTMNNAACSCCSNLSNRKWKLHNSFLSTYIHVYRIMCETFSSYNASTIKICNIDWINHKKKMLVNTLFIKCNCVFKKITTTSNDYYVCVFGARAFWKSIGVVVPYIMPGVAKRST